MWICRPSQIIESYENSIISTLNKSICCPSTFDVKGMIMHLDFTPGMPILDVNILNRHSAPLYTDFSAYSPGDLGRLMFGLLVQCAQYPVPENIKLTLREGWEGHNQLSIEVGMKIDPSGNCLKPTSDVVMEDLHDADRMKPRVQVETSSEAQSHGQEDCKCSSCCLTLTSDLSAEPDMESFKELSSRSRDWSSQHDGEWSDVRRVHLDCILRCLTDALTGLDIESLITSLSGTSDWIHFNDHQGFRAR